MDVLIVYGYHTKEKFALQVGEYLSSHNFNKRIEVVKYDGRHNKNGSTYYLRKFVEKFSPTISPIVLHDDQKVVPIDGFIIYSAKSKQERKSVRKYLFKFALNDKAQVCFSPILYLNQNYSIIDIELNPKAKEEKAASLVSRFSDYILNLYLRDNIII